MKLHRSSYNWVVFLDRVTDPLGWLLALFFDDYNLLISSTQIEREIIVLIKEEEEEGGGSLKHKSRGLRMCALISYVYICCMCVF